MMIGQQGVSMTNQNDRLQPSTGHSAALLNNDQKTRPPFTTEILKRHF